MAGEKPNPAADQTEDERFLNSALGLDDEGNPIEEEEGAEEGQEEKTEVEVPAEDVKALEDKIGRKLTEEEVKELAENVKEGKESKIEIPEDFADLKPENLPPELQPIFKKMLGSFTRSMQSAADVKKKAELFDYFSQNPQEVFKQMGLQIPRSEESTKQTKDEVTEFVSQLGIPEDHELYGAFKALGTAIVKVAKSSDDRSAEISKDNFQRNLNDFFEKNDGIRDDLEFIRTMDRLGKDFPKLFTTVEGLGKLKKLAVVELGREPKLKPKETQKKVDLYSLYRDMKKAKASKVTKPSATSHMGSTLKAAKNVKEAMAQAIEQLSKK